MVADEQTHTLPADADGARALRAFLRLCRPRRLRGSAGRASAKGAAPLRATVRRRAGAAGRSAGARLPAETLTTATRSTSSPRWASAARWRPRRRCARWLAGEYRSLRGEFARDAACRLGAAAARPIRARRQSGRGAARVRPLSVRACTAAARLLSLLRQNPDLVALLALILGTAPRLADIAGAASAGDGRADRSGVLRRAAGRREAWRARLAAVARAGRVLRGFSRPRAHVRPGADVPDRRAHPVRHGFGASRPARPMRGWPT